MYFILCFYYFITIGCYSQKKSNGESACRQDDPQHTQVGALRVSEAKLALLRIVSPAEDCAIRYP